MKKLYTIALCALVVLPATASTRFQARKTAKSAAHALVRRSPEVKPANYTEYMYIDGQWINLGKTIYKYNAEGQVTQSQCYYEEEGVLETTKYTYDDKGNIAETIILENNDNYLKNDYKYDNIVTDYVISRMSYDWEDGAWVENYRCETNEITRDADGNILSIVKSLPLGTTLVPSYKSVWSYVDGKPATFEYLANYGNAAAANWTSFDGLSYENIKWNRTNGQVIGTEIADFLNGDNRVESCVVKYDGEVDGYYFAEYTEGSDTDFKVSETTLDPEEVAVVSEYKTTDANGSYTFTSYEYFDDNGNIVTTPVYGMKIETKFDENKNMLSQLYYEIFEGDEELGDGFKYEYEFDDNGNVKQFIEYTYDYDSEEFVPSVKGVYGEYITPGAGIKDISAESAPEMTEYFTIEGAKVGSSNLAPGLYIKVSGGKATKIFVK